MKRGLTKNLHSSMAVMVVLMAAILTDSVAHGEVIVEPNKALLKEGESADLLCRYEEPLDYCRFEIPGEEKVLSLSPKWNKTPGFRYYGQGLAAGHCGVTIEHASAKHNGQVKCNLGAQGVEGDGYINLVVAITPEKPVIELLTKPERGTFAEGTLFQARCIVRNGRPAANISWLINDKQTDSRMVSDSEIHDTTADSNNNKVSTTIGKIQWHLTPDDNGIKLTCRSHHQIRDQDEEYQINVRYPPIKQPEALVYGLYLEQTAMVNITIRANPAPVIEWNINGLAIVPGDRNERYSAYEPRPVGDDFYNVSLAIAGLTPEDTTKTYILKASNALGLQEYIVRISSSSTPPSTGLDVGSIVGIVLALAILIVIVLLIIFARATGRWCFGGKSIKSPTSETSDTESAEVKTKTSEKQQKILRSKRLPKFTSLFCRKNEKSLNKNEAETNNGGDGIESGAATAAGPSGGDNSAGDGSNKSKQEDKQLVYAELVLKPSENKQPPPSKNSTEYAEIAYVQKPTSSTADENIAQNGTKK